MREDKNVKKRWRILIAVLAAAVLVVGGNLLWFAPSWFGRADPPQASALYKFPAPDPLAFAPPPGDAPPVEGYNPTPADFAEDEATGTGFVKNIVVVYFRRDATQEQKQAALEAVGGEVAGRADMIGKWEVRVAGGAGETLEELRALCALLEARPGVAAATPDHVIELAAQALPNDPWTGGGHTDAAQNCWWAQAVRLPEAWEYNAAVAARVMLGLVDHGVNTAHEELSGVVEAITNIGGAGYPQQPTDHGTGVAGVMAARAGNGAGLAGVAWNAEVFSVDAMNPAGAAGSTQMVYNAIAEEIRRGANAVNISLGVFGSGAYPEGLDEEGIARHARDAALLLSGLIGYGYGDFVIAQSAGNSASGAQAIRNGLFASVTPNNCQLEPAMAQMVCNRILVVGALRQSGAEYEMAGFSAVGSQVSLCAPGVDMFLPAAGAGYQITQGTSFSAPQVAAAAAWMFAANPALDGGQVGQLLKMDAVSPMAVRPAGGGAPAYRMLDCKRVMDAAYPARLLEPAPGSPALVSQMDLLVGGIPEKTPPGALASLVDAWGGELSHSAQGHFLGTGQQAFVTSPLGAQAVYTLAVPGDLNGDGRVDALDAQLLRRYMAGKWTPDYSMAAFLAAADYNGDGLVDEADADAMFARGME